MTTEASGNATSNYVYFDMPRRRKLGKGPAKHDPRTVRLERFLGSLPTPPPNSALVNAKLMASSGMLGNDTHGDCVIADDGHDIVLWSKLVGNAVAINDAQALAFYSQASLALNRSSADQGLVMLDFLKWRMKNGWPAPINRPLLGFGAFDHTNHTAIQQLINAGASVRFGIALPKTAETQPAPGGVWTLVSKTGDGKPGSWGGHDVPGIDYITLLPATGYTQQGVLVMTWGGIQLITWPFLDYYCDEAYGVIPTDVAPGFDAAGFIAELKSIGAYYGPDVPTPVPPTPPTPTPAAVKYTMQTTVKGTDGSVYTSPALGIN